MDDELVPTTILFRKSSKWKFKNIVTYRKQLIRDVTSLLIDRYIEDFEDERLSEDKFSFFEEVQEQEFSSWNEFKRRNNLDEC